MNEDQLSELEMLEAIYSGSHVKLQLPQCSTEAKDDCPCMELSACITIDNPEPLTVYLAESTAASLPETAPLRRTVSGRHVEAIAKLRRLPPLEFQATLPMDYLDTSVSEGTPPKFKLFACWLSTSQLVQVCEQLDQLWLEHVCEPILFTWLEWLRTELLLFLAIGSTLILARSNQQPACDCQDQRVLAQGRANNLVALMTWAKHDAEQQLDEQGGLCSVCYLERPAHEVMLPKQCSHNCCSSCRHVATRIYAPLGTMPRCPLPDCGSELLPFCEDDKATAPPARLSKEVIGTEFQGSIVFCPRCEVKGKDTAVIFDLEPVGHALYSADDACRCQCPACSCVFCGICRETFHALQCCGSSPSAGLFLRNPQLTKRVAERAVLQYLEAVGQKKIRFSIVLDVFKKLEAKEGSLYQFSADKVSFAMGLPTGSLGGGDFSLVGMQKLDKAIMSWLARQCWFRSCRSVNEFYRNNILPQWSPYPLTTAQEAASQAYLEKLTARMPVRDNSGRATLESIRSAELDALAAIGEDSTATKLEQLQVCQLLGSQAQDFYKESVKSVASTLNVAVGDIEDLDGPCEKFISEFYRWMDELQEPAALIACLRACGTLQISHHLDYRLGCRKLATQLGLPTFSFSLNVAGSCREGKVTSMQGVDEAALAWFRQSIASDKDASSLMVPWEACRLLGLDASTAFQTILNASFQQKRASWKHLDASGNCAEIRTKWFEAEAPDANTLVAKLKLCPCPKLRKSQFYKVQVCRLLEMLGVPETYVNTGEDCDLQAIKETVLRWLVADLSSLAELLLKLRAARQLGLQKHPQVQAAMKEFAHLANIPEAWSLDDILEAMGNEKMLSKVDVQNMPGALCVFQTLFNFSYEMISTKDRRGGLMGASLRVERVEQVRNLHVWAEYVTKREQVAHGNAGSFIHLGTRTDEWREQASAGPAQRFIDGLEPLRDDVNEHFLFHGTSPENAAAIVGDNFRLRLAGSHGTLYGRGIYLAESVSKSDEYAYHQQDDLRTIVVCRVTLGNNLYTEDPIPNTRDLETSCGLHSKEPAPYQSVCGDRTICRGTYREFIVYNQALVYPEFVVHYSRMH